MNQNERVRETKLGSASLRWCFYVGVLTLLLAATGCGLKGSSLPALRTLSWGAWIDGIPSPSGGPTPQSFEQFSEMVGKAPTLVGNGQWWYDTESWSDFNTLLNDPATSDTDWANRVVRRGATPVFMWSAWNPLRAPDCATREADFLAYVRKYSLRKIADGDFDAYIRRWARQARDWKRPIYFRTMHELNYRNLVTDPCNEYFTSWTASLEIRGVVYNTPADAVDAWRRIVNLFREEGASNVKWIWSVLSYPSAGYGGENPVSLASIYPGDNYVDVVGIECYNQHANDWLSCSERARGIYLEASDLTKRPLMLVEIGAIEDPRKAGWLEEAFDPMNKNSIYQQLPRVESVMYWNDSRDAAPLWINSSTASVAAFKRSIVNSRYR